MWWTCRRVTELKCSVQSGLFLTAQTRLDQQPGQHAGDDADGQSPMHVHAGQRADHVGLADGQRRGLVQAGRIAQRAFDDVVHQRDGDIGQQQAGDRLVDAAIVAQRTGEPDPDTAGDHPGNGHAQQHHDGRRAQQGHGHGGGRQPAHHQRSLAADHHQAEPRGNGDAESGEQQRRGALQAVLPGEPATEAALPDQFVGLF